MYALLQPVTSLNATIIADSFKCTLFDTSPIHGIEIFRWDLFTPAAILTIAKFSTQAPASPQESFASLTHESLTRVSFLSSNMASYSVVHQIYGDIMEKSRNKGKERVIHAIETEPRAMKIEKSQGMHGGDGSRDENAGKRWWKLNWKVWSCMHTIYQRWSFPTGSSSSRDNNQRYVINETQSSSSDVEDSNSKSWWNFQASMDSEGIMDYSYNTHKDLEMGIITTLRHWEFTSLGFQARPLYLSIP